MVPGGIRDYGRGMKTSRLEAFSDGVIAIIITIMVLNLKIPQDVSFRGLLEAWPVFLSYVLSFLVVAIMWVNHHHLIHTARRVDAGLLWANNNLLFWMSLIPFATAYMGQNHAQPFAVAVYAIVLAFASGSFWVLRFSIARHRLAEPGITRLHRRVQVKNSVSTILYALAAPMAYRSIWVSVAIFVLIPALYFLPSSEAERQAQET